ncbi:MAG: hypothetical protein M1132_08350 [Chloroflexi bacterium]|nr:hypothetical protein [Chloroflexota bacterium]
MICYFLLFRSLFPDAAQVRAAFLYPLEVTSARQAEVEDFATIPRFPRE